MHMELAVFALQLYLRLAERLAVELPNIVLLLVEVLSISVGNQIFLANYAFWTIVHLFMQHHLLLEIADGKFVFVHLSLESFDLLVLVIELVLEDFALVVVHQFFALELELGVHFLFQVGLGSWFALLALNVDVLVVNERSYLMLFVEPKHKQNREDIYNNADFDCEVVGFWF